MPSIPLSERVHQLQARLARACEACGRAPGSVELLPVSKRQPSSLIREAAELGFRTFGENYVQEGTAKAAEMPGLDFVLLGPLQRNKAKLALLHFTEIMTVDRPELVERLRVLSEELTLDRGVWIQADLWEEATKLGGCPSEGIESLVGAVEACPRLHWQGFMAIPPPGYSQAFTELASLRDRWRQKTGRGIRLSMGMSDDLEEAVAAGSDQVRIGTAFFGARNVQP